MAGLGSILPFLSFIMAVINFFRPKRNPESKSPFIVISVKDLLSNLSSPLNVTPERIERGLQENLKPGIHLFLGTSGVGKTREAADFIQKFSCVSGAKVVYLSKGYINSTVPLPTPSDVKRIIVMIDDYDWGLASAASNSFVEREGAYLDAFVNLRNLYNRLNSQLDLHALVVTVNQHRLSVSPSDVNNILPDCVLQEVPPITRDEFKKFTISSANALGVRLSDGTVDLLSESCDGRFDSVATFLASFDKGSEIQKTEIKKFADNRSTIWKIFVGKLSEEQIHIYRNVKLLKDFKLLPRIEYIHALLQLDHIYFEAEDVKRLMASIWPVKNSQALIYDGQFAPPEYSLGLSERVIRAVLKSTHLRRSNRYSFQEETKDFCSLLIQFKVSKVHLRLLRKMCKWYPRDRYFAYLLASAYASREEYIRGVFVLYRILKDYDTLDVFFGNWIEIKLHFLLAELFEAIDRHGKKGPWKRHSYIEREYQRAAMLADTNFLDMSIDDWGEPKRLDGEPISDEEKQSLKNFHKEFGFGIPSQISIDRKYLRAMVHQKYSEYLLEEIHRERDALLHEEIVTKLLPEYGEAYLNCARAYCGIGDTRRALVFVEQASSLLPKHMDPVFYEYYVSQMKWAIFYDMGDMSTAQKWFDKCYELVQKKPLSDDLELKRYLEGYKLNSDVWKHKEQLASLRQKEFGEELIYSVPSFNIKLCLPGDWKIDGEVFSGDVLATTFAPETTWNDMAQCPNDASVSLVYSTQQKGMSMNAEAFGVRYLKAMRQVGKTEWFLAEGPITYGEISLCRWNFKIASSWPKEGIFIVFASPVYRMHINVMCQTCGKHIFWPVLTSIAESFTQNFLHDPNWKLKI